MSFLPGRHISQELTLFMWICSNRTINLNATKVLKKTGRQ